MPKDDFSSLSRPIHPMPEFVKLALEESGLMEAYRKRPPYQQNDYLGWINRAKRPQTKEKRRIITDALGGDKYTAIRDVLLKNVVTDPNFRTFQIYLDNILAPSGRLIANNLDTFSQGVQKIKEFRDTLEKELTS